jgi:hypothetical protein
VPVSAFEASKQGGSTPSISINISGLQGASSGLPEAVEVVEDVVDVEVRNLDSTDSQEL